MFEWWNRRSWMLQDVGEGGGGGAAVAEAEPGGGEVVEEVVEEEPQPGEPETPEGRVLGEEEPEEEEPEIDMATPSGRAFAAMRTQIKKLTDKLEGANPEQVTAMQAKIDELTAELGKLRPPEKDALETYFEGQKPLTAEQKDALDDWAAAATDDEDKQDRELLAKRMRDPGFRKALLLPVLKDESFRKAFLAPILPLVQAMFRSLDLNSWQTEQMAEAFAKFGDVEVGQAETDEEGKVVKPARKLGDYLPPGLKHRSKVLEHHTKMVKEGGGKWVPVRSAFDALQKQLEEEGKAGAGAAAAAAEAATKRTLKEVTQRRTATGGPRSQVTPARGGLGRPGKRTPAEIEKLLQSGGDIALP